jgi:hypothetical protein
MSVSTNTVQIAGQDWPVRFDFTTIKRSLKLFGLRWISQADEMIAMLSDEGPEGAEGMPPEAVTPFIANAIRSGLLFTEDDRDCPSEKEIERAQSVDMQFFTRFIQALVPQQAAEETGEAQTELIDDVPAKKSGPKKKPNPKTTKP